MYKKYFYKSPIWIAVVIIILSVSVRMNWLGKGAYAFSDETRFEASQQLVNQLMQGNIQTACATLLTTQGRPADALFNSIPAFLQYITPHQEGINHPDSLIIVQYYYLFVFAALAYIFYWITTLLFPKTVYQPLLALICYVLLINNQVYARHILPYDCSLALSLLALGLIISKHKKEGFIPIATKITSGIVVSFAWLSYPGYYWLPILIIIYLILSMRSRQIRDVVSNVLPFVAGAGLVLVLFELLYWWYGKSLLYSLAGLSLGINQGDYHESLEFMLRYMEETNGTIGWVLVYVFWITSSLCLVILLRGRMQNFDPVKVLLGLSFGAWCFHMILGEFLEFMVFYGRLIHAFIPFILWAFLLCCAQIQRAALGVWIIVLFLCFYSFWNFHEVYKNIVYPRDVLFTYSRKKDVQQEPVSVINLSQKEAIVPYCNIHKPYAFYNIEDRVVDSLITFYNTGILYPIEGQSIDNCDLELGKTLVEAPYYLCFSPYAYEGYSPAAREKLRTGVYTTKVMLKNN